MPTTGAAIFVKTPGFSPIKTRLAKDIGHGKALEFYRLALNCAQETYKNIDVIPHWAIGEEEALNDSLWQSFDQMYTGPDCLGARQHHIYSTLLEKYDRVLMICTDSPQITPAYLNNLIEVLDTHDYAIAPANDGGYNCFAGKKTIPKKTWTSVTYSAKDTCKNLCNKLDGSIFMGALYTDVDHVGDLQALRSELPASISMAQQKLLTWIDSLVLD